MRPPDLAGIRARVLLIRGRYDWMVPVEVSIAILNHIADSRLVLLNDALSAIGDQFDARAEPLDRCRYGSGASYQKAQRCPQSFLRSQWQEWQAYRLLVRPGRALQPGGTVRCFANDLVLLALRPRQSESPTTASPVARRTLKSSRAELALCDRVSGAVSAFAGAAL